MDRMKNLLRWPFVVLKVLLGSFSLSGALITSFFIMLSLKLTGNWDLSWWWVCSPFIFIYVVGLLLAIYQAGQSSSGHSS